MRSFYAPNIVDVGQEQILEHSEQQHLFVTLRARVGTQIGLLDGKGCKGVATVQDGRKIIVDERLVVEEPSRKVRLFCAAPRKKELDQLLKQAVEVGVWSVHLLQCSRSVALPEAKDGNLRWKSLILEACKQSGKLYAPEVFAMQSLDSALKLVKNANYFGVFGAVRGEAGKKIVTNNQDIALFIGPEGGFTDEEEEQMCKNNLLPWRFGEYVMRLETAAISGVSILNYLTQESGE